MENPYECPPDPSEPAIDASFSKDQTRNWCDLPHEVLFDIALRLNWRTHLTRLRGVCPAWRSSLPFSNFPTFTCLNVPPLKPDLPSDLLLLHQRFHLLSPLPSATTSHQGGSDPHPLGGRWLARMGDIRTNKWHLFNPLNIHEYFFSSPPISGSLNLLDCHIMELACVFSIISGSQTKAEPITKKIVHSFNMDSGCHFSVLAQLERKNGGGLFLFRLGDSKWIQIQEANNALRILDIACHKGKFYAFDLSSWRVGLIDPTNTMATMEFICAPGILGDPIDDMYTVTFEDGCLYFFRNLYFVPSDRRLYLVVEVEKQSDNSAKNVAMIVFVLKEEEGDEEGYKYNWEHVKSLEDHIFFIGYDVSFSLPSASKNLPQWNPNSICLFTWPFPMMFDGFTEDGYGNMPEGVELLKSITYAEYWMYFRIFNLENVDEGVVPFKKLPKRLYTGLFFPPPAWVKWRCPSLDNLEVRLEGLKFRGEFDIPFED